MLKPVTKLFFWTMLRAAFMTLHRMRNLPLWLLLAAATFLGWRPAAAEHVACVASSSTSSIDSCGEAASSPVEMSGLETETASILLAVQHLLPEDSVPEDPLGSVLHTNSTEWQHHWHWFSRLTATSVDLGAQSLSLVLVRTQSVTSAMSLLRRSFTGTTAPFGAVLLCVLIPLAFIMMAWLLYAGTHMQTHASGPGPLKTSTTGGTQPLLSGSDSPSHGGEPWPRDAPPLRSSTGGLPLQQQAQIPFPQRSSSGSVGTNLSPARGSAKKVLVPSLPLAQLNLQNNKESLPPEFLQMMSPEASTPASSVNGLDSPRQSVDHGPSIKMLLRCLDRDEGLPDGPAPGHSRSSQPTSSGHIAGSFGPQSGSSAAGANIPVFMGPSEAASKEVPRLIDGFECHPDVRVLGGLNPTAGAADSQAGGCAPEFGVPQSGMAMSSSTQRSVQFAD